MSKLKDLRELNGISKIDMCKMLHMSEASYSKRECNIEDMKFRDIIKICNFSISLSQLWKIVPLAFWLLSTFVLNIRYTSRMEKISLRPSS